MRGKIFLAVLPLLILLAIPFILRPRRIGQDNSGIPERIVIITAHNESIRYEYEQAFARYCREKFGREIALDFRSPGGTSDIVRYIADRFEAEFRRYFESDPANGEWTAEIAEAFANPAVGLDIARFSLKVGYEYQLGFWGHLDGKQMHNVKLSVTYTF